MSENWNYVKFGDLFNYENKSKIKAGDGLIEGTYPFYTSSVELTKYVNESQFGNISLVFGTGGNASIHYVDTPFSVSTDCLVAFAKDPSKVYSKFAYYYLSGNINLLEEGFKGAGLKHISKGYINEILIPIPPLATQKRIAEILDAADALRRNDQELLKKYDELAQAIFIDMFGDPVKNEKGWEVKIIKEFGTILTGNTPSRAEMSNYNSNFKEWIKTDNILEGNLYVSAAREFLSEIGAKKGRKVPKGSLLVACIAGSIESIGRAALTDREVCFNQQINAIMPNEKVDSMFLYYLFKYSRKHIQEHASNGMKRMLSKGEFEKINMIMPDIKMQKEFADIISRFELQIEKFKKSKHNSESLFETLIQETFKGKLVS
jgi:type I restriction enzyme S subunit